LLPVSSTLPLIGPSASNGVPLAFELQDARIRIKGIRIFIGISFGRGGSICRIVVENRALVDPGKHEKLAESGAANA
jgi:hypothetical protein